MSDPSAMRLEWLDNGVVVVAMEERESRNTFSTAFTEGLDSAFSAIAADPAVRTVVIHGYDSYFSCGGTHDQLVDLCEGRLKYTDILDFAMLLNCKVPVIAAMQGHGIGGGFVFGLYADIVILAEECVYNTNFMQYGFTPGMGATCIVPRKLGPVLGWELLLTGNNYRGAELRDRGAQVQVMKKADVVPSALAQAKQLAETPVASLRELKRRFVETIQEELAAAVERELEMQQLTFSLEEVRERIDALYSP